MMERGTRTEEAVGRAKPRKPYKGMAMEGAIARWYSRNRGKSIEEYRSWAKMASEHAPEGGSVLEVAPGPGYLSVELARLGRQRVVGVDISKTFVEIASDRARAVGVDVDFRQGDAAEMPFAEDTFDLAICTAAFKNFPDPVMVLDEIYRVMKSGGEALIIDMRRDASMKDVGEHVDAMRLSRTDSFVTKFTFRFMLRRWAYARGQLIDMVSKSHFGSCRLVEEGIGFEMWLKKP